MTHAASLIALHSVHAEICARLHAAVFSEAERWAAAAFQGLLASPGTPGWIIEDCGDPCGLLLVRHCLDEAEVLTIAVAPACRRRGFARMMLEQAIESLARQGVESLFLEVSVGNRAAIALYKAQGFTECGFRRAYYPDGSDALVMRHDLHSSMR